MSRRVRRSERMVRIDPVQRKWIDEMQARNAKGEGWRVLKFYLIFWVVCILFAMLVLA